MHVEPALDAEEAFPKRKEVFVVCINKIHHRRIIENKHRLYVQEVIY